MLRKYRLSLVIVFCTVELILAFLLHTVGGMLSCHFSFAAVVLAFLVCFSFFEKSAAYLFTQLALLFTVAADSILVFQRMEHATLAMCFFSVTQLAYAARLHAALAPKKRSLHLVVRALASVLAVAAVYLAVGKAADALAAVSLFYFANLLLNAILACGGFRKNAVFAVGLVLFVLCDVFVGFSMLGGYLPLPNTRVMNFLTSPPINMAWVFYLPSQTLLALSLTPYKKAA